MVCIKTSEKNFLLYQCEYNAFFFFFLNSLEEVKRLSGKREMRGVLSIHL